MLCRVPPSVYHQRVSSALTSAACVVRVSPAVRPRSVRCNPLSTSWILFIPRDPAGILTSPWVFFLSTQIPHHGGLYASAPGWSDHVLHPCRLSTWHTQYCWIAHHRQPCTLNKWTTRCGPFWSLYTSGRPPLDHYRPTQCLLNAGPASRVLASIHSALVSTSCWQERVHIQRGALLQTVKWKYPLILQVCIYRLLEGLWQTMLQTAKWKYLLISQVCIYTVFWKGCDRHCCRQRNGSIC